MGYYISTFYWYWLPVLIPQWMGKTVPNWGNYQSQAVSAWCRYPLEYTVDSICAVTCRNSGFGGNADFSTSNLVADVNPGKDGCIVRVVNYNASYIHEVYATYIVFGY